jgi:hypothetical protein
MSVLFFYMLFLTKNQITYYRIKITTLNKLEKSIRKRRKTTNNLIRIFVSGCYMENYGKITEEEELYQLQTENRHLKDTIIALREELERVQFTQTSKVQRAVAKANDEIIYLTATIGTLRDSLEKKNMKR